MFYKQGLLFMQQIFLFNKFFLSGLLKLGFLSRAGPIETKQTTFKKKKKNHWKLAFSVCFITSSFNYENYYLFNNLLNKSTKKGKQISAARIWTWVLNLLRIAIVLQRISCHVSHRFLFYWILFNKLKRTIGKFYL